MERVVDECQEDSPESDTDLSLLEHISPSGWDNVLLSDNTPLTEV